MQKFSDALERVLWWFAYLLLGIIVVALFISVIMRYFFGVTSELLLEIAQKSQVIMVFAMAGVLVKHSKHLTLDILFERFPPRVKAWLKLLFYALILAFSAAWFSGSVSVLRLDMRTGTLTEMAELPWWWYRAFMVLGAALLFIFTFMQLLSEAPKAFKGTKE